MVPRQVSNTSGAPNWHDQLSEGSFRKIKKRFVQLYVLRVPLLSLSRKTTHRHHTFLPYLSLTLDTVFPIFSQPHTMICKQIPLQASEDAAPVRARPHRAPVRARPHRAPTPRIGAEVEGGAAVAGGAGVVGVS
jgi:hypothetical protein